MAFPLLFTGGNSSATKDKKPKPNGGYQPRDSSRAKEIPINENGNSPGESKGSETGNKIMQTAGVGH